MNVQRSASLRQNGSWPVGPQPGRGVSQRKTSSSTTGVNLGSAAGGVSPLILWKIIQMFETTNYHFEVLPVMNCNHHASPNIHAAPEMGLLSSEEVAAWRRCLCRFDLWVVVPTLVGGVLSVHKTTIQVCFQITIGGSKWRTWDPPSSTLLILTLFIHL